jgi:hypothetical protein
VPGNWDRAEKGTKEDFLELYRHCEAQFTDEIRLITVNYGFKKWKLIPGNTVKP